MSTTAAVPGAIDREYWLAHCEGYRVRTGMRDLGVVEEVDVVDGRAAALVLRGGVFGTRRLVVLADDVAAVIPRDERLVLRAADGQSSSDGSSVLSAAGRRRAFQCEQCGHRSVAAIAPERCPTCGGSAWRTLP